MSESAKRAASDLDANKAAKKSKSDNLSDQEEQSSTSSSRSPSPTTKAAQRVGVSHLLQTDAIPSRPTEAPPPIPEPVHELRTVGIEREGGAPIPDYFFISSDVPNHPVYNFLDSITEVSIYFTN